MKSENDLESQVRALHAQNFSVRQIAEQLGIGKSTVHRMLQEMGLAGGDGPEAGKATGQSQPKYSDDVERERLRLEHEYKMRALDVKEELARAKQEGRQMAEHNKKQRQAEEARQQQLHKEAVARQRAAERDLLRQFHDHVRFVVEQNEHPRSPGKTWIDQRAKLKNLKAAIEVHFDTHGDPKHSVAIIHYVNALLGGVSRIINQHQGPKFLKRRVSPELSDEAMEELADMLDLTCFWEELEDDDSEDDEDDSDDDDEEDEQDDDGDFDEDDDEDDDLDEDDE